MDKMSFQTSSIFFKKIFHLSMYIFKVLSLLSLQYIVPDQNMCQTIFQATTWKAYQIIWNHNDILPGTE